MLDSTPTAPLLDLAATRDIALAQVAALTDHDTPALAASADLLVTSGGVSLGGRDPVRPTFAAAGGRIAA
ncbi:MAG: hypothetical protein WAT25_20105, partial [Paracoccaceae bacterium]